MSLSYGSEYSDYQVQEYQSHSQPQIDGGAHSLYSAAVEYIPPPEGHVVDAQGRLLKSYEALIDSDELPEDPALFVSRWRRQETSSSLDWAWTTKVVWPEFPCAVCFRKLDVYERTQPELQIGTLDAKDSLELRRTQGWYPVRSVFFVDQRHASNTCELYLESAGPPRRSKYRPKEKNNPRDLAKWMIVDTLVAFHSPAAAQGTTKLSVDYTDLPDRYFLSSEPTPALGRRRLYHFAAYSATQFYVLEKRVTHDALEGEGGSGLTYYIEAGPVVHARKDWRLIGSFYGFDQPLPGSSKFTVYRRLDPFPRMVISMEPILHAHEWDDSLSFYAFDIPVPCSAKYTIQHCLRSIYSLRESVQRHRITTDDARLPWEFRMNIFVIPATLNDCTIIPYQRHYS